MKHKWREHRMYPATRNYHICKICGLYKNEENEKIPCRGVGHDEALQSEESAVEHGSLKNGECVWCGRTECNCDPEDQM